LGLFSGPPVLYLAFYVSFPLIICRPGLLMYGGLMETIQSLTGWRSGEWADWLANGIGILLSVIAFKTYIPNGLKLFKSKY
jgi:VanZ family protein